MSEVTRINSYLHFDKALCTGCSECIKVCPTRAIRIKGRRSFRIVDQCVGCGECINTCPTGAVKTDTFDYEAFEKDKAAVAIVSPSLYVQFPGTMPNDVRQGLRNMGFHQVLDLSFYLEMYQYATEEFIRRNRKTGEAPWPLISPLCPLVVRLIAFRFPNLLPHVLPIKRPVAIMAQEVKQRFSAKADKEKDAATLYHITPCPAKIVSNRSFFLQERPYMDKGIGINGIYPKLLQHIEKIKKADLMPFSEEGLHVTASGRDLIWNTSGGEIAGMSIDRSFALSGLKETIAYLEKIELGLFKSMEYVELRTCPEACIGGPLTAIDKYLARSCAQKMVKLLGFGRRLSRFKVYELYEKGCFFTETSPSELADLFDTKKDPLTIEALEGIENIMDLIQGMDCAACGAPDCRTFAEDVVRGKATLEDCLLVRARKISKTQDNKTRIIERES